MRDVTISKHGEGYRMAEWADRDNPTDAELHPDGAEYAMYTTLPCDLVDYVKTKCADDVSKMLSGFFHF